MRYIVATVLLSALFVGAQASLASTSAAKPTKLRAVLSVKKEVKKDFIILRIPDFRATISVACKRLTTTMYKCEWWAEAKMPEMADELICAYSGKARVKFLKYGIDTTLYETRITHDYVGTLCQK